VGEAVAVASAANGALVVGGGRGRSILAEATLVLLILLLLLHCRWWSLVEVWTRSHG